MAWTECTFKTWVMTIEEFLHKYGDDMMKRLSDKVTVEVEKDDEFITEATGIYKRKKWYKKKELVGVEMAHLRYAVIG